MYCSATICQSPRGRSAAGRRFTQRNRYSLCVPFNVCVPILDLYTSTQKRDFDNHTPPVNP
jgi:hypothetical protein